MINKKEILLLDDNSITNFYNEDIIEETKLFDKIYIFENPIGALEWLKIKVEKKEAVPGCFIVDINMPDMSGFEFLDELESVFENLPSYPRTFILSTSDQEKDKQKFVKTFMAQEYLVKPLTTAQINKLIK